MSYLEQARRNKANAEKAQAFDAMQQQGRERELYDFGRSDGTNEAMAAFEQELINRLRQQPTAPSSPSGLADSFRGL